MDSLEKSHYTTPDVYDLVYSAYTDDIGFYVDTAKTAKGPVLELGCGTGRVLLPTLQAGVDIDGIDLRPEMLEALKAKAAALGLKPRVFVGDMRDFTAPRRYALITIPFRAFLHNLTSDDQIRTLRVAREHLDSGGRLVFNVFHPSFDRLAQRDGEPYLEAELRHPSTGLPVRKFVTPFRDRVNQLLRAENEVQLLDAEGRTNVVHRYEFTLRWIFKAELELLLHLAGWPRWQIKGGFDGRPLEKDADEMVVTAWKD